MKNRRFRGWRRPCCKRRLLAFFAAGMALWLMLSELGLSSVSEELTSEAARAYLLEKMNYAVKEALSENGGEFVSISRNAEGRITAVTADAGRLNALKAAVLTKLSESLNGRARAYVPAGSLTGSALLNGIGPKVPVRLYIEASADVSFSSGFATAGLNQSCHRITMTVTAGAVSQSKRFSVELTAETSAVLAETVTVGEIPEFTLAGS